MAKPRILNFTEADSTTWKWLDGRLEADFSHVDSVPRKSIERLIQRPALSRYRAAAEAAWKSRTVDLLVTHGPLATVWTEAVRRMLRIRTPHLAFVFNFTPPLPAGFRRAVMRWAFRTVDRFVVFSRMEIATYSKAFGIPAEKFMMIHWGVGEPLVTAVPPGVSGRYICAVGGEGRDYATLMSAMQRLPHIKAEVVARPHNVAGLQIPPNVTVRTNISLGEANAIVRDCQFSVLPLLHSEVPCGHVTLVTAMKLGKAMVVTDSSGVLDYVLDGETALLARAGSAGDLAEKIERLWADPAAAEAMGHAARKFAVRHCTEESTIDAVTRCVSELAGPNGVPAYLNSGRVGSSE